MMRPRTIYLLGRAHMMVFADLVDQLKSFDITPTQYRILSLLQDGSGLSSAEMARRTDITPQSMNEIINALERKGLLRRRESAENRRILRIAITKDGTKILKHCDGVVDELEAQLFSEFDTKELNNLRGYLLKLRQGKVGSEDNTLEATADRP